MTLEEQNLLVDTCARRLQAKSGSVLDNGTRMIMKLSMLDFIIAFTAKIMEVGMARVTDKIEHKLLEQAMVIKISRYASYNLSSIIGSLMISWGMAIIIASMRMEFEKQILKTNPLLRSIDKQLQQLQRYLIPLLQGQSAVNNKTVVARLNKDLLTKILSYLPNECSNCIKTLLSPGNIGILPSVLENMLYDPDEQIMEIHDIEILKYYEQNITKEWMKRTNTILEPKSKLMLWFASREKASANSMRDVLLTDADKAAAKIQNSLC